MNTHGSPPSRGLILALAQINPTVGDIQGNVAKILEYYEKAKAQGAELVVFPELALVGYPPEDLVLSHAFREAAMKAADEIAEKTTGGPAIVFGSVLEKNGKVFNAALLADDGKISQVKHKLSLPNYGIFDEKRIFSTGDMPHVVQCSKIKIAVLICEDMWIGKQAQSLKGQGVELIIVINASPFEVEKLARRKAVATESVAHLGVPLVYVNMVGGQDDIVFDGGSFVMDAQGAVAFQMKEFEEGVALYPVGGKAAAQDPAQSLRASQDEQIYRALCLGLSDYVNKNGFPGVLLGLSGGIDSALTAAVAVDALGADKVRGVLLPSPYTSQDSVEDALELTKNLGIHTDTIPITPGMETMQKTLGSIFQLTMTDPATGGNLQARLRGLTLMAMSNQTGFMLLSTGNKSEIAVGYSTLYGDSCGGYNVLKDVYKTQVYALARWRNQESGFRIQDSGQKDGSVTCIIPERSITKPPTAELAPGQKDEDQLPPYAVLDAILALHIEGQLSGAEIALNGFDPLVVEKVVKLVRCSEYKRRQSCPGVKISSMMFGKDRRYPLTNGWKG